MFVVGGGECECDKEIKKIKDTRRREIEDHALKVETLAGPVAPYYNITLHKIPRLVKCPDTHSTGAPASVSDSRSHSQTVTLYVAPAYGPTCP